MHKRLVDDNLQQSLASGCQAMQLATDKTVIDKLAAFVTLLSKWNRVYNLTAIRDPLDMVSRHILDSLVVLPWISGKYLLDVGTGAGLPGLAVAIARPDTMVTCLDASVKKLRFVQQAVTELGINNVRVEHQRAQDFQAKEKFNQVISRAFCSLPTMHQRSAHLCETNGEILAMKGTVPEQELRQLKALHLQPEVIALQVPGLDEQRHLIKWPPLISNGQTK